MAFLAAPGLSSSRLRAATGRLTPSGLHGSKLSYGGIHRQAAGVPSVPARPTAPRRRGAAPVLAANGGAPTCQPAPAVRHFDFLVLGSGIAGLSYALKVAQHGRVALVTKASADEGCTRYAQGGICAVLDATDSVADHVRDTMIAGAFLNDRRWVGPRAAQDDGSAGDGWLSGAAWRLRWLDELWEL